MIRSVQAKNFKHLWEWRGGGGIKLFDTNVSFSVRLKYDTLSGKADRKAKQSYSDVFLGIGVVF